MRQSEAERARIERQMRKGVLGVAALAALSAAPAHGYGLAQRLKPVLGGTVPEGTLYPLLASFEAAGWIRHDWDTSQPGPARKIHSLTPDGAAAFGALMQGWRETVTKIEDMAAS
jgi:PadR family transcriptional regulator PadR